MNALDAFLVTLIVALAIFMLYRAFKPRPRKNAACGCSECKVSKATVLARKPE